MRSRAWFVSITMLGSGLLAGCNLSQESPTAPAVAFPEGAVAGTSSDASGSGTKVAICHRREDGTYHRFDLPAPAAPAHRSHGDAAVGEAVPGAVLMMFNEACAPVPKTFVITRGSWVVNDLQRSQFEIGGPELSAQGGWYFASRLGVCLSCTTGQTTAVDALFDNLTPDTQYPQATGWATVANASYPSPLEFGGPLRFVTESFTIPALAPGATMVEVQAPFTLTGKLKGYLVAGRRDPLLAFDVPVSGHGTATVRFILGEYFWSMRFDFED